MTLSVKSMTSLGAILSASLILMVILSGTLQIGGQNSSALSDLKARTKIHHIIFIIQENHTFDNLFGVYPGLRQRYALNLTACLPVTLGQKKPCVSPWNANNNVMVQATDNPHAWYSSQYSYNGGKMNGFVAAITKYGKPGMNYTYAMSYYTNRTIPDYWLYAQYYELDANFVESILSFSAPNHLYAVSAQAGGLVYQPEYPRFNLTFANIADKLSKTGINWKYYTDGWNDSIDCTGRYNTTYVQNSFSPSTWNGTRYWIPLAYFRSVQTTPSMCNRLANMRDLEQDINSNNLPNVSWIAPDAAESDHPAQSNLTAGQEYVSSIVNAISTSPAWDSTAIFLTWDDYGGYYDGVVPKQIDQYGPGFRVPMIVISPYAKQETISYGKTYALPNGVNSSQEDFSAFLSTIEYNWMLHNLTERDGFEPNLFYLLNFSQTPLQPLILPTSSLARYPYMNCVSLDICRLGGASSGPIVSFSPAMSEGTQLALLNSGDGDATD